MTEEVKRYRQAIADARRRLNADFEWYPYDTLSGIDHAVRLMGSSHTDVLPLAGGGRRVLDVGPADGELAFFLESLGYRVTVVDHPAYNHNGMRGLRALKAALGSQVEIHEADLNRHFTLPHDSYDVAFFLGALYHLRNPLYVLEELARRAGWCFLSTRVARRLPDGAAMPAGMPLAYLLEEDELNHDNSNYFIFSEAALRVALKRSHWEVRETRSLGDSERSDPVRLDRDERFFCLVESTYDRLANLQLLEGWHESEETGWRWTARDFAARLAAGSARRRVLKMQVYVPEELITQFGRQGLDIEVNGAPIAGVEYEAAGLHTIVRPLEAAEGDLLLRFHAAAALPPDAEDDRERGLIVTSIRVE
ncbi:MAG TPA: methyltransferase domain-containing protein [Bryobacteraceae bacterium]